jgi:peptide/nickel transport system substrate-binding protein
MKTLAVVAAAWKKLGIKTVITSQPDDTLFGTWADNGTLAHGRFQVALFSWVGSPDPDSWVNEMASRYVDRRQSTHSDLNQNYAGFTDSVIDGGFRRGASTYDPAQRAAAYHAVQQQLNRQAYWIGLYYRDTISTSDGKIKHYAPSPTTSGETWNAYDWAT